MYLFFDTETTGLPKNYKAPVTDLENWPRLVQLAYIYTDEKGQTIETGNHIIKPVGFEIPKQSSDVHGITQEIALEKGEDLIIVLNKFRAFALNCKYLVAHNMSFDEKIIGSEFIRNKIESIKPTKEKICTMLATVNFCELPGMYGFKWPKLQELHNKLFGFEFEAAHDALNDVRATVKCFFELKLRKII